MSKTVKPLEAYDIDRFGPLLGVSDEGSAAPTIAEAASQSAKSRAHGRADASVNGVIIDGERMGSAGEVPIGPDEYRQVLPAAEGRTFASTNVGVRVNTRMYQPLPEFRVAEAAHDEEAWLESVFARFAPFLATPDGEPRPLTVRLRTETRECHAALRQLVPKLEAGRAAKRLGSAELHQLSLLLVFDGEISGAGPLGEIENLMELASELGVPELAIDGRLVEAARRRLSIQGLLNVLSPADTRRLLARAGALGLRLCYHYEADDETAARTIWTGLSSAQHQGLTAAKYGLFPLTFEQQDSVVRQVQRWTESWTAIPAFYVDTALVTRDDVFESDRCVEAGTLWMGMIHRHGAKVALVDCPDRIDPHRLLKTGGAGDRGVLELEQVGRLVEHARSLGLRVLWSGGIQPKQAFELAKLGVAGIFTTGSTARKVAVHGALTGDRQLAAQAEPTLPGVRRIHALVQGGFLCRVIGASEKALVQEIGMRCAALWEGSASGEAFDEALAAVDESLTRGWLRHWS